MIIFRPWESQRIVKYLKDCNVKKHIQQNLTRRVFLKKVGTTAVGAMAVPLVVPSRVFGENSPSNQITIGCIGVGGMGTNNMRSFLGLSDCRVLAVCDVDRNHVQRAKGIVDQSYSNNDCNAYNDYRQLIARDDIDAIMIATPDHWHALVAVAAAKAGKDIYGEKPIAHSIKEGRAIADAVKRYGRVWQTGSWQRSQANFRKACELVLNGRIGKVNRIEVGLPVGPPSKENIPFVVQNPPSHLDYNFWVGPSPWLPYQEKYVHGDWRWRLEFGGGAILDWIGHYLDIAHWGMGWDNTGPYEIMGKGEFQSRGIYNAAIRFRVEMKYPGDVDVVVADGQQIRNGTAWHGDKGSIWVDRGRLEVSPKELLQESVRPGEILLYRSPGHQREFLDCIKSRKQTLAPAETAHRSATPGHLGQISMMLGRKLRWDAEKEQIIGDEIANRMLGNAMRSPWNLS